MELTNFRNLREDNNFDNLKDLNIFIGPNNCGKSNILRAINIISKVESNQEIRPPCKCEGIREILQKEIKEEDLRNYYRNVYTPEINDEHLTRGGFKLSFFFNESFLSEIVKHISGEKNKNLKDVTDKIKKIIESQGGPPPSPGEDNVVKHWHTNVFPNFTALTLNKSQGHGRALNPHISLFSIPKIIEIIKEKIVSIPESRLDKYKEKPIYNYIYESGPNPRKDEETRLIEGYLRRIVDPKINTRSLDVRNKKLLLIDKENFECSVNEQGSGVRSLACLGWDIIRSKEGSIILIDEPELGLNPAGKQELLKMIIEKSKDTQMFIATQDPTFLNPNFWKNENVSVFLYSIPKEKFIKVNLEQNCEDPETFGGYLPHTTSMKNIHLYVEGPSDVYTIQNFLMGWLQHEFSGKWHEKFNKIGIFNLGGSCWEHFLYTIPNDPYRSVVLLDKDKADTAKDICSKYNEERESSTAFPIFHFCDDLNDVDKIFNKKEECPIYCLKEGEMEDYLDSRPSSKNKDPEIAYEMVKRDNIPKEFGEIFKILTKNL